MDERAAQSDRPQRSRFESGQAGSECVESSQVDSPAPPVSSETRVLESSQVPAPARARPKRPPQPPLQDLPRKPRSGMRVHRYQLIRKLGRGGMGSVYLARDTRLGRLAAIKFLKISSPVLVQRFLAEARATALCNHENIVVIYDVDQYHGLPYMALEYLEGKTLRQMMKQARAERADDNGRLAHALLPVERAIEIAVPMLRALRRAHQMGIVHRDLKPGNVMLTNSGAVKVLDFGIAKVVGAHREASVALSSLATGPESIITARQSAPDLRPSDKPAGRSARRDSASMTRTGALVGTLPYMSPEQLHVRAKIDPRSDIWAAGIILYEMVTGHHPLAPLSKKKLLTVKNLRAPLPRLSELRPDLQEFAEVVDRCLAKRRSARIGTVAELLTELESFSGRRQHRTLVAGQNPFTGLATFQEHDAERFLGRGEDAAAVVARVRSHPLVAVAGPSGIGKSSLVRAGVIPALRQSGEGWEPLIGRPGRKPLETLVDLLWQLSYRALSPPVLAAEDPPLASGRDPDDPHGPEDPDGPLARDSQRLLDRPELTSRDAVRERLVAEPGFLGAELRGWAERRARRVLLFIDEFEELYTLDVPASERAAFMASLVGIADDASSPLRVILCTRSDFLERMAESREFMAAVTRGLVFLPPIARAGLRTALVQPVHAAGYRFESEAMIESMLDALDDTPGALTLLQFAAASLWEARDRQARLLTEDSYQSIGGLAGALARHADQVLAGMSSQQIALTQQIFKRLVTPERTRAIVSVSELRELTSRDGLAASEEITRVLHDLTAARLLMIETRTAELGRDGSTVEVVHESLIDSWPTLARWLHESRDDLAFVARIRTAATHWSESGEAEGMLWRGDIEAEARSWSERYQGALSERERRFLAAVFGLQERTARRRHLLVGGLIVGLTGLVLAAAVALVTLRTEDRDSRRQYQRAIHQLQNTARAADSARRDAAIRAERAERDLVDLRRALDERELQVSRLRAVIDELRVDLSSRGDPLP